MPAWVSRAFYLKPLSYEFFNQLVYALNQLLLSSTFLPARTLFQMSSFIHLNTRAYETTFLEQNGDPGRRRRQL